METSLHPTSRFSGVRRATSLMIFWLILNTLCGIIFLVLTFVAVAKYIEEAPVPAVIFGIFVSAAVLCGIAIHHLCKLRSGILTTCRVFCWLTISAAIFFSTIAFIPVLDTPKDLRAILSLIIVLAITGPVIFLTLWTERALVRAAKEIADFNARGFPIRLSIPLTPVPPKQ